MLCSSVMTGTADYESQKLMETIKSEETVYAVHEQWEDASRQTGVRNGRGKRSERWHEVRCPLRNALLPLHACPADVFCFDAHQLTLADDWQVADELDEKPTTMDDVGPYYTFGELGRLERRYQQQAVKNPEDLNLSHSLFGKNQASFFIPGSRTG